AGSAGGRAPRTVGRSKFGRAVRTQSFFSIPAGARSARNGDLETSARGYRVRLQMSARALQLNRLPLKLSGENCSRRAAVVGDDDGLGEDAVPRTREPRACRLRVQRAGAADFSTSAKATPRIARICVAPAGVIVTARLSRRRVIQPRSRQRRSRQAPTWPARW